MLQISLVSFLSSFKSDMAISRHSCGSRSSLIGDKLEILQLLIVTFHFRSNGL